MKNLKDKSSTLRLLLATQFEMLASFQRQLRSVLALITFQTQYNLLCCLGLISLAKTRRGIILSCGRRVLFDLHNRFVSCRNVVFPRPLVLGHGEDRDDGNGARCWEGRIGPEGEVDGIGYLSEDTGFTGFVLCYFVDGVFSAVFALAVGSTGLWNVDYKLEIDTDEGKDTHGGDRLRLGCLVVVINNRAVSKV
jgi:hypothetical protein